MRIGCTQNLMEINRRYVNTDIWFTVLSIMRTNNIRIPYVWKWQSQWLANLYLNVAEYKKSTCKALSMMDLDKINYDLILELLEWIVDGDHQVRFITKVLISIVHNYNSRMKTCTWYVILENFNWTFWLGFGFHLPGT